MEGPVLLSVEAARTKNTIRRMDPKMTRLSRPLLGFSLLVSLAFAASAAFAKNDFVNRVIVFGDSLSDSGYYSSLSPMAPPGMAFTTRPDLVAPEVFASELGLALRTAYGVDGTNHATGAARVSLPNMLSVPITTQIDRVLASGERFRSSDLIYIQGGGNDYFAFAAGGGTDPSILNTAAEQLAEQVARLQNAGAEQIVTMAIQSGGAEGIKFFNERYEAALAERGVNVLYFDTDALFDEMVREAEAFGFTAFLDPACGAVSSLQCTPADWVTPDANETHILADSVHPAGKAQRIQGQAIASLLMAPEQIGQLSYASQALFRAHRSLSQPAYRDGLGQEVGSNAWFARLGYHDFSSDGSQQITGVDEDGIMLALGLDHRLHQDTSVGVSITFSDGEGDFSHGRGDYDVDALSAIFYTQGKAGRLHINADAMLGRARYEDLRREVQLGPVLRQHEGKTDADFFGLGVSVATDFVFGDQLILRPHVGLDYQKVRIDSYREREAQSTAARFGSQKLDSLVASLGVSLSNSTAASLHYFIQAQYNYDFEDDDRHIRLLPYGAPVSYRSDLYLADDEYFTYGAGLSLRLNPSVRVEAGVSGTSGRDELERDTYYLGLSLQM